MLSAPEFLYDDVVEIMHERLVYEFGGPLGFNNENLFRSALHRPFNRWSYGEALIPDLFDLAAAYGYGLIKNHGFRDGNKRIGAAACLLFLRANGREIRARPAQLVTVFVAVARGRMSEMTLACWLRRRAA